MEQLLLFLPALICPIAMGLCMWMMAKHMGSSKDEDRAEHGTEAADREPVKVSAEADPVSRI